MAISRLRKNRYIKCSFIIIACYLLASIGVNKVINPLYYFIKTEEHSLNYYEKDNSLYIDVTALKKSDQYLNIYISEIQPFGSVVYLYSDVDPKEKVYTLLSLDSNSINKSDLPSNKGTIFIRLNDLNKDGINISQITGSEKRKVDSFSMLKIFISCILLVTFWSFTRNLKKKYAM